jgi:GT2 family glycosyltransferase
VVVATRNRGRELLSSLRRLQDLEERPSIVVVDNASTDGTPELVRRHHPGVRVVALESNAGAAARNIGVEELDTPVVAFADDDSWWASGALRTAARLFEAHPSLGLIAARVLLGPEQKIDSCCVEMAASPLRRNATLPGPRVLGFIACGAVVRRAAFLEAGGFHERLGIGGEEALLSLDLRSAGWELCYVEEIVAHHHPSRSREPERRTRLVTRNALWTSWLRHPGSVAARELRGALAAGMRHRAARRGFVDAVGGLGWIMRDRRPLPAEVRSDLRTLARGRPSRPPAV